jgi:hypothetical protein
LLDTVLAGATCGCQAAWSKAPKCRVLYFCLVSLSLLATVKLLQLQRYTVSKCHNVGAVVSRIYIGCRSESLQRIDMAMLQHSME